VANTPAPMSHRPTAEILRDWRAARAAHDRPRMVVLQSELIARSRENYKFDRKVYKMLPYLELVEDPVADRLVSILMRGLKNQPQSVIELGLLINKNVNASGKD
jgi:hypothetical protein